MSAKKNKPIGARPKQAGYFPSPTAANKKVVDDAFTKAADIEANTALSSGNHKPTLGENIVEPGRLYVHDPHAPADQSPHHFYLPTKYSDLLASIAGYQKFLAAAPSSTGAKLIEALRTYVVIFAHGDLYNDAPRHVLLIQKPLDSSLHPGMLNLPGGRVEPKESPHDAACREFYEETGWQCGSPQLMGALIPAMYDFQQESPYLVYCYRCIIRTIDKQTAKDETHQLNVEKHCPQWYLISELGTGTSREKIVPNVACVVTHMAAETRCFLIQDAWREQDFAPTPDPNFNAQVPPRLRCQSQEIVTYYTPDRTLEARMGVMKKRRIET